MSSNFPFTTKVFKFTLGVFIGLGMWGLTLMILLILN